MAPPPSDRLSLRLDGALARLGGMALIPMLLLALACDGLIGGCSGQDLGGKRLWQGPWTDDGGLAGLVPELGPSPGAPGDRPHLSRVVRTNGGDRDPPRAADG